MSSIEISFKNYVNENLLKTRKTSRTITNLGEGIAVRRAGRRGVDFISMSLGIDADVGFGMEYENQLDQFARKFGGKVGGAGYGGDTRDYSIYFKTDKDAIRFGKEVRKPAVKRKWAIKEIYGPTIYFEDGENLDILESALPFTFGPNVTASAVYGQGMGFNPDAYPYGEQEENTDKNKEEEFKMDDEGEDDFDLEDEDEEFDLEQEKEDEGDMNRQGVIRTVPNAHLIYKRQNEEGNYDELWIYNTGADMKDELEIRRNILAGTDIPTNRTKSDDGTQLYTLSSMGNAQYLLIRGMPN